MNPPRNDLRWSIWERFLSLRLERVPRWVVDRGRRPRMNEMW